MSVLSAIAVWVFSAKRPAWDIHNSHLMLDPTYLSETGTLVSEPTHAVLLLPYTYTDIG